MARGGVSIFVKKNLIFNQLNILHHCNEQDIECCVVQFEYKHSNIYVLAIYRVPTGNFDLFLNTLESIIDYLYKLTAEFVICGNININYLTESYHKQCLNSLLAPFNLMSIVNFPTRIQNYSSTAFDNVFIDSSRKEHISIEPVINGLSDHDAQLLVIKI
jgi:exonuclease III